MHVAIIKALPLVIAMAALQVHAEAKPQRRADGPAAAFSAIPNAIGKAVRATFGKERTRKPVKKYRAHRVKMRSVEEDHPALPGVVPLPYAAESAPVGTTAEAAPQGAAVPVPTPRPQPDATSRTSDEVPAPTAEEPVDTAALVVPDKAPIPTQSPAAPREAVIPTPVPVTPPAAEPPIAALPPPGQRQRYDPDPRSQTVALSVMPQAEVACRARLRTLGVTFDEQPAQSSPDGCSLPYPVSVSGLGSDVSLQPAALMDCAMAETMASFTGSVIEPALKQHYGHDLRAISQASAYVCRPRNGTTKLSEHAFGNALDIARFTLDDGTVVDVKPEPGDKAANVLSAIREAACGPFKTVLGPGSDADHALHLHFDLAPRKHGGAYCH